MISLPNCSQLGTFLIEGPNELDWNLREGSFVNLKSIFKTLEAYDHFICALNRREFAKLDTSPNDVSGLFSWNDVNSLLGMISLGFTATEDKIFRIVKNGQEAPISRIWAKQPQSIAVTNRTQLNERAIHSVLSEGHTLGINGLHRLNTSISEFAQSLSYEILAPVQVNAYASFRPESGFTTHWDGHDVLAIQIDGSKRWRVFKPTTSYPLPTHDVGSRDFDEESAELVWDGTLREGEALYVPRGWWHDVVAEEGRSLHLTVGMRNITGANVMRWIMHRLADEVDFRKDVPTRGGQGEIREYTAKLRDTVSRYITDEVVAEYISALPSYLQNKSLPSLPYISKEDVDSENNDYQFSVRNAKSMFLSISEDALVLTDGIYEWEYDSSAQSSLSVLTCVRQPTWLSDICRHQNDAELTKEVFSTLVAEGVLVINDTKPHAEAAVS